MPIAKPLIEAKDLSFFYGPNPVLEHVSFTIGRGDYVGIIGPNGGGKTTLAKILVGLLAPRSGEILIEGQPVGSFKKKYEIGYVPQRISQENINFPATVYEIVESGRIPRANFFSRLNKNDRAAIKRALKTAQIDDLANKLIGDLSGGQRQRAYVARALAGEPEVLILDEPFVGIDVAAQKDFYLFLKELNHRHKMTIIFVSHDIEIIAGQVKSILCLNRGLLCSGSPEILHQPNFVENFYGKKIIHLHSH